jgi:hypothetical protein
MKIQQQFVHYPHVRIPCKCVGCQSARRSSRNLGDLDDIRPSTKACRRIGYEHHQLVDAGNMNEGGNVIRRNGLAAHARHIFGIAEKRDDEPL